MSPLCVGLGGGGRGQVGETRRLPGESTCVGTLDFHVLAHHTTSLGLSFLACGRALGALNKGASTILSGSVPSAALGRGGGVSR